MDFRKHKSMPNVGIAMTPFPYIARPSDDVEKVEKLMKEHDIRHIPVQEDGRLIGLVTEWGLRYLVSQELPATDKRKICVRDVALSDPYVVEIDTPLDQVVTTMADRRIGSAIVVKKGKLVGVFAVSDICRALAALLEVRFPPPVDDDIA